MILQIGPGAAFQAAELTDALARRFLGVPFVTLLGALQSGVGRVLGEITRPRSPKLSPRQIASTLRETQVARLRGEALQTATDPFTGGLVTFTESQAGVAPQLVLEAALRRESSRLPQPTRARQVPFSPEAVESIQSFFQSLPTFDPRAALQERQRAISAIRSLGIPQRSRIASGFRQTRFISQRQVT